MMWERRDAGMAMVWLVDALDRRFAQIKDERTVWTCGRMEFDPGAPSIVPGRAVAMLQFRDADLAVMERFEAALKELGRRGEQGRALHHRGREHPAHLAVIA